MIGLLGLGYLAGLTVYVVSIPIQAGRVLDPVLRPEGFTAQNYMLFGRQYHGTIRGRQVDIQVMPPHRFKPGLVDIRVETNPGLSAAIGYQRPLLDCRDCSLLALDNPDLSHLQIFAREQEQARALLTDPAISPILNRLMFDQSPLKRRERQFRELYLQPHRLWLRLHLQQINPVEFRQWFEDALLLAETVE